MVDESKQVFCELTYGKHTKSGAVLPTTEKAAMMMDEEYREFVFTDKNGMEVLRVGADDVEVLELTSTGFLFPKSELLAVTDMDDDGSVCTFQARKIERRQRDLLTGMIDFFVEGMYFRRGHMWIRDEGAYEAWKEEEDGGIPEGPDDDPDEK